MGTGLDRLSPTRAVVSSHEHTGSVVATVVDSPQLMPQVSEFEIDKWLKELTPAQGEASLSEPFL